MADSSARLTVFTRYTRLGASSRLRFHDAAGALEEAGFRPHYSSFFSSAYLRRLYAGRGKSRFLFAAALLRRLCCLLFTGGPLLIEYELLPFIPWRWEKLFLAGRRYVLNFDDDVWRKYDGLPHLSDKYDLLCRHAAGIVTANRMLEERCRALNPHTIRIPTAVNTADFSARPAKRKKFTLVWTGTPVTYPHLLSAADRLQEAAAETAFDLLIIGAPSDAVPLDGVNCIFEEWNQDTEAVLLASAHAGIMPLPENDAFAAGKSAFKLIKYMAAGLPVIASPVGENLYTVHHGVNGFLASGPAGWSAAVSALAGEDTRARLGAAAYESAAEFSQEKCMPELAAFIAAVLR